MTAPRAGRVGRLVAVALVAFVLLGWADGSLGVAWPTMRSSFTRPLSDLGLLLAFGSSGYLSASAGYGWAHRRAGTGRLLVIGCALFGIGLTGVAIAPAWAMVAISAILLGLGGGLIDTGMNAHAALAFDVRSINLLHGAFGVGATIGPLVMALSLGAGLAWRGGYGLAAIAQLAVVLVVWRSRGEWAGAEVVSGEDDLELPRRLVRRWAMLVLFFLYTGVEVATGQWSFTLLTEARGLSTASAGFWVAAYWGGLTAGRFGVGSVGGRFKPSSILDGSVVTAVVGVAILWLDPLGLGYAGLPVAGLGFAAVFPTLVSLTPARIGRSRSTSSIGYQMAAANVGAATIPWVLGAVAGAAGLTALGPGLFVAVTALAIAHLVSERMMRHPGPAGA